MKNRLYQLLLLLFIPYFVHTEYIGKFPTMTSWISQFDKLPKNRQGADAAQHSGFARCGNKEQQWKEFEAVLHDWLEMMVHGSLAIEKHWMVSNSGTQKPQDSFFKTKNVQVEFQPFAQKLVLQPGESIYLRGDLHGDIFSLLEQLKDLKKQGVIDDHFKIRKPGIWFAFLGDYVDRGQYGCEVLYTMMRLAIANPEHMIYVRGNHEDVTIQKHYGFKKEVDHKFDDTDGYKHQTMARIHDFMPVVCYVGCQDQQGVTHYLQLCHGGIELGYNPADLLDTTHKQYQLLGKLDRQLAYKKLLPKAYSYQDQLKAIYGHMEDGLLFKNPTSHNLLGFMWNDFDVLNEKQIAYNADRGGGFIYGKIATQDVLHLQSSQKSKIEGVIRAHQHTSDPLNPMMKGLVESKGIYKLWNPYEKELVRSLQNGLVWTCNVGADTPYGSGVGFDFDTYEKLTVQQQYEDWKLQVFNTKVL